MAVSELRSNLQPVADSPASPAAPRGAGDAPTSGAVFFRRVWSLSWRGIVYGGILLYAASLMILLFRRETTAKGRDQCLEHVHQLQMLCAAYAQSHDGAWPPSLAAAQGSMPADQFAKLLASPVSGRRYVYVGAGLGTDSPRQTVGIYEPLGTHHSQSSRHRSTVFGYINGSRGVSEAPGVDAVIAELEAGHNPPRDGFGG